MTFTEKLTYALLVAGVLLIAGVIGVAAALIPAQILVFALAYYGIHTGLLANWLLVVAVEIVVASGVAAATSIIKD